MDLKIALKKIILKWRIMLIILIPAMMFFTLVIIASPSPVVANKGKADLSGMDFSQGKVVSLKGQWEFYWGKLLMPDNFKSDSIPQMDSFIKVPGIWSDYDGTNYTRQGIATYRLLLYYPPTLKDPSLRIQNVGNAYKLYVNGELMSKVGNVIDDKANMKNDDKIVIINLPKDTQKIELVFQVSNYNCVSGGLRATPVLGSRQVLEQQRMTMLLLQICFIGGALIFCFYYFFLFLLQRKNKTALLFAIFCFFTVLRSMLMGEIPLQIMFPNVPPELRMNINYLTGYNYVAIVILFVHSIYASEFNKKVMSLFLLPSLGFDAVLLFNGPVVMTFYTNYIYILMLLQILYLMCVMIKAVLRKKDNAVLMFITICGLIGAICVDIINFILIGSVYLTCMFLLGNFFVILAMSFIQAKQQANDHEKLILYNKKLLEADKLKDKIMATEMSFLQAQIKPHFLYNALSAIANVSEKDGKAAGKLIIDLAIYLRGSLEFNNLDKMSTIEKELDFINTYFHIEQARFGQKIQLEKEIEIPLEVQVPVLIIQPLVENAVRHGISKKPGGGTVTVRMMQKDENIYIEIEDNGVGINSEKLKAILDGTSPKQGVGLLNINNRLLKLYGRGLEITSEPGHTCVRLLIPEGGIQ